MDYEIFLLSLKFECMVEATTDVSCYSLSYIVYIRLVSFFMVICK